MAGCIAPSLEIIYFYQNHAPLSNKEMCGASDEASVAVLYLVSSENGDTALTKKWAA